MTAFLMGRPNATSAVFFIFSSTMAEICSGVKSLGSSSTSTSMMGLPVALSSLTVNGMILISSWHSLNWRPMMRLTLKSVRLVFCAAWRLAESPTRRPSSVKATQDGVVLSPSELARTCASPSFHTETQEYVVPRSMPMTGSTSDMSAILPPLSICCSLALRTSASPSSHWTLFGSHAMPPA